MEDSRLKKTHSSEAGRLNGDSQRHPADRRRRLETVPEPLPSGLRGLKQDCVFGAAAASIAGLAVWVFILGQKTHLEIGWDALRVAIAGVAVAEWLKFGLTGKHLRLGEALQDLLVSGVLAATASSLPILQAPSAWSDLFLLSQPIAAASIVVYHAVNAYRLATSSQHLSPFGGALILASPYAVGSLLLLESADLLRIAGPSPVAGGWAALPAVLGFLARVAVVFGFNLAVANAIGLATKRSWLRSFKGTLSLLTVAVAAVAAPRSPITGPARWSRHGPRHYGSDCHLADDHRFAGRAVGRSLPGHGPGLGCDSWPGPFAGDRFMNIPCRA